MKQLFKYYLCFVLVLAVSLLTYFSLKQPFYIDLPGLVFMLITIFLEYNSLIDESSELLVSFTGCSYIFLTLNYGIYPSIIIYFIALLINLGTMNKDFLNMADLKKKYRNQNEKISHKNLVLKLIFNISKHTIDMSLVYLSLNLLKISYVNLSDIWKIALVYVLMLVIDFLMLVLVMLLNAGKLPKGLISVTKVVPLVFYDIIMCINLINAYRDRGAIGALLVYSILFPLQKTILMYYKIKAQEKELFTDSLTEAYNLRYFEDLLLNKLTKREPFSLIMVDLDKFKQINDSFGHLAGDKALIEFSRVMRKKIIKNNYFCRYGGDEFIIVIGNPYQANDIANQILDVFNDYAIDYEGNKINISLSIGIYQHINSEEDSIADIIKKVDKAMYQSKKKGNNNITYYDSSI